MPKSPEPEGSPRLMTTMEIAAEHGVSRQSIHAYRRSGAFPQPVEGGDSTRPRFRADEVAAFFEANPKQPGKKRSSPPQQQGDPVSATETPRTPTTIVTIVNPQPPKYTYADVDGDRLLITTADIPDAGGGVYFKTDPNGSSVPLSELPALMEKLREIAEAAGGQQ